MANLNRFTLPLLLLVSCAPSLPSTPQCAADADCGESLVCQDGTCVAQPPGDCRSEETRPCGPEPIGACRRGVQKCVDGAFELTCTGAVSGNPETCNATDDDCDGLVDEGVTQTFYADSDGDGFGSSAADAETRQGCQPPAGFVASHTDCDDRLRAINPSAEEVCDSANVDEDCDGTANDGCACSAIGVSQGCCAGRGTQTCEARSGGASLSACTVVASVEVCNGIDDDCDGQTDELYRVSSPDGGRVELSDGGTIELDGGCTVGVGACARTGGSTCVNGSLACAATAGTPSEEICNDVDDDCDGQTDEPSASLCAVAGQSCLVGSCACPAGQSVCGTSCQSIGGSCTAGTGACAREGTVLCTNGAAACSATAGAPATETCNNLDDDCDGQTDELSATLCPATGQTCTLATCSCPTVQTVCGTSCQTLGGTCSAGVGACLRSGTVACISGGAACNATAGTPVAETCDGLDNDCDGTADNGVTITCYPDGDNDLYATSTQASQQCPDNARVAFGKCPTGYVAPSASAGTDCDGLNPNLYRLVSTRADADNDTFCAGSAATQCVGAAAPAGRRFSSSCASTDDCNDGNAGLFVLASTRADADGDSYCVGGASDWCVGPNAPAGRRFTGQCVAGADDCNDSSSTQFTSRVVRTDADGDQYCVGSNTTQCAGNAPLAGTRLASSCLGNDCRDSNAFATTTCSVPGGFTTEYHSMSCGIGLPGTTDTFVPTTTFCPTSFSVGNLRTEKTSGAGTCSVVSANTLRQSCTGFDASTCRIVGDCSAN